MLLRAAAIAVLVPALSAAQDRSSDIFTWEGRLASGATLTVKHFNGAVDVRETPGDKVQFRASRSSRRRQELPFDSAHARHRGTICSVYPRREQRQRPEPAL